MPRRAAKDLTAAFVESVKPRADGKFAEYPDRDCPGLVLRVTPVGSRIWSLRYATAAGKQARLRLGEYPGIGLKRARELGHAARGQVAQGADPQAEKRRARAELKARKIHTIADLIDDYLSHTERTCRPSTHALQRHLLNRHVRSALGRERLEDVRKANVRSIMEKLHKDGHAVTANRVRARIGALYRHAQRRLDIRVDNPTAGVDEYEEGSRDRVLTDTELSALYRVFSDPANAPDDLSPGVALALRLAAITLQRGGEVSGIDEREIDLDQGLWVIPAARTKNGSKTKRPHVVPLSPQALEIVQESQRLKGGAARKGPLFPSPRDVTKPITRAALTRAMSRICKQLDIDDATPHDLRRTGSTLMTSERLRIPRFHVSCVLNHVSETGGVSAIYDRYEYVTEKRTALEAWGALLVRIVSKSLSVAQNGVDSPTTEDSIEMSP
jgi:integrase